MVSQTAPRARNQSLRHSLEFILKPDIARAIFFSLFINILVLSPSWYMLEVYDRVVNSQNIRTLWMLTILVLFLYAILELLEWVRTAIFQKAGHLVDESLRDRIFANIFKAKLNQMPGGSNQPITDLKTIQNAINSPALLALIDAPFAIIALIFLFSIHRDLGWFAIGGALILFAVAWVNERFVHPPLAEASQHAMGAQNYFNGAIRNVQVIKSMGMLSRIHSAWAKKYHQFLKQQSVASDRAGANSAISKLTQTMQGSFILGFACWLVIQGEISGQGAEMIVASILGGRMLAPLVQLIAHWRVVVNARDSFARLDQFLSAFPSAQEKMRLPKPEGTLSVDGLVAAAPNSVTPIIRGISFNLSAGQSLAIIGPSASGKTTLAKLLTGIWPATHGKVRLDGVDIYGWDKAELGPHVGYLSQNAELFEGTLAENIARFGPSDITKLKEAVNMSGLDDFVAKLDRGLETELGEEGEFLSGGQRQRVALARAIYGLPKFIVLDEPNASLDQAGDVALSHAINLLKDKGATLIIITHRQSLLDLMDEVMVLVDGQVKLHGPRDEVMDALKQQAKLPTSINTQHAGDKK